MLATPIARLAIIATLSPDSKSLGFVVQLLGDGMIFRELTLDAYSDD
jgi:hypothetical protein